MSKISNDITALIMIIYLLGILLMGASLYRWYDNLKYPQVPLEQLEEKSGLLKSCKIVQYKGEFLLISLQDDDGFYAVRAYNYKARNWQPFADSCQEGDYIRLLVRKDGNIYEIERNGKVILSYEEASKGRLEQIKIDTPQLKVEFVIYSIFIILGTVFFLFKLRFKLK